MEKYVFISYSSKDSAIARDICKYLKEKNIKYWIAPQSLFAGEDYPSQIVEAIRNCSVFVLLASHSTNISNHVKNEVASAFDAGKPLVAVRLEDLEFSDEYLYYLKRKHWIDAYSDMDEAQKQLGITLSTYLENKPNGELNLDKNKDDGEPAKQKLDRKGIAECLKRLTSKYSYSLYERLNTEQKYAEFAEQGNILLKNIVKLEYCGKKLDSPENYIEFASKALCDNLNVSMQVLGLPGSGKNMLLQLVFLT